MAVASIALRGIDTSGGNLLDRWAVLALNMFGAVLDCATIGVVIQQRHKPIRILAILHFLLLVAIGPGSFIAIAIIRILLISFLCRVRRSYLSLSRYHLPNYPARHDPPFQTLDWQAATSSHRPLTCPFRGSWSKE